MKKELPSSPPGGEGSSTLEEESTQEPEIIDAEMNDRESERSALIINSTDESYCLPVPGLYCYKCLRFVSAEVVVFFFVFVFYYYQYFIQQYLFQWYAIEALENGTNTSQKVCYNQTLINALSGSNSTTDEVQEKAAYTNLMIILATYIPSFLTNLVISPLSDKYGRKPVIIMVLIGEFLAVVLSIIATYLVLDISWFILCGFLLGFTGGVSTLMSVSFAYVSDITSQRWRTVHLGLLQAMVYIATAISSGVFNVWLENANCDFRAPIWLMIAASSAGLLYSLVMPETLSKEERVQLSQSKRGTAGLLRGVKIFFWPRLGLWQLWFIALSIFIVVFSESGENTITIPFLLHKPLEWNRDLIGIYGIVRSISHALVLFLLLPLFSYFKFPDPLIAILGIAVTVGTNIFLGFVKLSWEMFLVGLLQGMESLLLPALLGMNSKITQQDDQGAMFSILSTLSLLAALLGSMAYSLVYPNTLKHGFPVGSSYWLMAIIWTFPVPLVLLGWFFGQKKPTCNTTPEGLTSHVNINEDTVK